MSGYFEFRSPEDLARKAQRDLDAFDKHASANDLWNAVVTTNHVWDWVKHDSTLEVSVRASRPSRATNDDVKLLMDLANGLKHFKREGTPPTKRHHYGSARLGNAVPGEAKLGSPPATKYLVTQPDGSEVEVRHVVRDVLDAWHDFLAEARA